MVRGILWDEILWSERVSEFLGVEILWSESMAAPPHVYLSDIQTFSKSSQGKYWGDLRQFGRMMGGVENSWKACKCSSHSPYTVQHITIWEYPGTLTISIFFFDEDCLFYQVKLEIFLKIIVSTWCKHCWRGCCGSGRSSRCGRRCPASKPDQIGFISDRIWFCCEIKKKNLFGICHSQIFHLASYWVEPA